MIFAYGLRVWLPRVWQASRKTRSTYDLRVSPPCMTSVYDSANGSRMALKKILFPKQRKHGGVLTSSVKDAYLFDPPPAVAGVTLGT